MKTCNSNIPVITQSDSQHAEQSPPLAGVENPLTELRAIIFGFMRLLTLLREPSIKFARVNVSIATSLMLAIRRSVSSVNLRRALIWLLILALFTQSNMALAGVTAKKSKVFAQYRIADSEAYTLLTGIISDVAESVPGFSAVSSVFEESIYILLPFEDESVSISQSRRAAVSRRYIENRLPELPELPVLPAHLRSVLQPFAPDHKKSLLTALLSGEPQSVSQLTDAAVSRNRPTINNGRIEGSLRVLSGTQNITINGGAEITSDLYVPGTPQIIVNGGASHGGIVDGSGSLTPSNYKIILNGGVVLPGRIHRRTDPLALPSDIPSSVPQHSGSRTVNINSPSDVSKIGQWSTVRALNVNSAGLVIVVPPGNYGTFTLNGNSRLNFTAGTYNFSGTLNLNGGSVIQATDDVIINIAQTFNLNNGSMVTGAGTSAADVRLNVLSASLTINGNSQITALVRAPNANVHINGNCTVRGQVIAQNLLLNGGRIIGDAVGAGDITPPVVSITSPENGFSTTDSSIVVSGSASDSVPGASGIARVMVNGLEAVYNQSAQTWAVAGVPLQLGSNTITAQAFDAAGNQSTTEISVTRNQQTDTLAPAISITSPADNSVTQESLITLSGTSFDTGAVTSGIAGVRVNGLDALLDVLAGTWTVSGVSLNTGSNTITARATDGAGNQSTAVITVIRQESPPPDTQAPVVEITSPANGFSTLDSSITVTGTALDSGAGATGIARIVVNGVEAVLNPGNNTWTAAGVALTAGDNTVVAEAEDRASPPNTGRAEIIVNRRIAAPPEIDITNPRPGIVTSATSMTVSGTVTAGASDVSVSVTVNGESAQIAGGQFTKAVTLTEGSNTITVAATDSLGQTSQAFVTVVSDITQPTVALVNLPATVQPGGNYTIRAEPFDALGIASVDFAVDGHTVRTASAEPFEFALNIPSTAITGQSIVVTVTARDLAGETATDTGRTSVAGPGGISGYVFDDATGYGIEAAMAIANGGLEVVSDSSGAFVIISSNTSGVIRLFKPQYTPVERTYAVGPGGSVALFDARLTRLSSEANIIIASGGTATGDGGRISVTFGAGSFADGTDIRVTSISPQGLINLLPFGWSPVPGAVIDIRQVDASGEASGSFSNVANLTITGTPGLDAGTQVVLARYDEAAHIWRVVDANAVAGPSGALEASIPGAGQYAFLVADTGATAPPVAVAFQPLPSSLQASASALNTATATAIASPRAAIISAEARSTISFMATSTTKLPSGVAIEASFGESFNLFDQTNPLLVDRVAQDFVLYSYPSSTVSGPNRLGAFFVAKPTRFDFAIGQFRSGNVRVEIRSGRPLGEGALIGSAGGTVASENGSIRLDIPEGALASDTPVSVTETIPNQISLDMPAGYEIVGAADIDLAATSISSGAALSMPIVMGDTNRLVVARLVTVAGRRSPRLVARAVVSDGRLVSTTLQPTVPAGISLSGINVTGRYVFIRVPSPFGYLTGDVTENGVASQMVRISTDRAPFIDVTDTNGRYITICEAGDALGIPNTVEAASQVTDATGEATVILAGQDSVAHSAINLRSVPLSVTSITPAAGATGVTVTSQVTVSFSKPVQAATITGSTLRLATASGNPVLGSTTLLAGNRVAVLTPATRLAGETEYRVIVTTAVRDIYGKPIEAAFESSFTTAAVVNEQGRLKPENIKLSYPNSQGFSTLIIPAGSVPEGSIIIVVNNTTGATVTRIAGLDEIRLEILASVGDEIIVIVRQPDGSEYRVSQGAYRRDDGFTSVGRNGGVVTSEDGQTALTIPKNAISGQLDLKLTAKSEADIRLPREGEMSAANMAFAGGVEIEAQGDFTIEKELHLELPAPADAIEDERVAFLTPARVTLDGEEIDIWEAVTSGRVEGGRLKTNSPPFTGIGLLFLGATYFFAFRPVRKKAVFGRITEPVSEIDSTLRPVAGALCVLNQSL